MLKVWEGLVPDCVVVAYVPQVLDSHINKIACSRVQPTEPGIGLPLAIEGQDKLATAELTVQHVDRVRAAPLMRSHALAELIERLGTASDQELCSLPPRVWGGRR